jgi:hypothetical protein
VQEQGPAHADEPRGEIARRDVVAAGLAAAGAVLAGRAGVAEAAHDTDIPYSSQTVMHVDVTNTASGSTRVSSNTGTAAFVALNDYPVGISRPDGMLGRTRSTFANAAGVAGAHEAASGGIGVLGTSAAADGAGVYGFAGSAAPSVVAPPGTGVFGVGPATGVVGRSPAGNGVAGETAGQVGVDGVATAAGVGVQGTSATGTGVRASTQTGTALHAVAGDAGQAARFVGRTVVEGTLEVTGGIVGQVVAPAAEPAPGPAPAASPPQAAGGSAAPQSPWIEAFGEARLRDGRATVRLPREIGRRRYQVFLTEYGDGGGLYVRTRGRRSFGVRSRKRGSRARFGYRIVARR